jgi:hypothetical protein
LGVVNTAGSFVLAIGNYLIDFSGTLNSAGGVITKFAISGEKNGVQFAIQSWETGQPATAGVSTQSISLDPWFVSSNGTDAFVFYSTAATVFSGGAGVMGGTVRIVAM